MIHLLYHGHCADGFAAACIARFFLGAENVTLHPVSYDDANQLPVPNHLEGNIVYLDYTPPREVIQVFLDAGRAHHLTIIDHHKTAAQIHSDLGQDVMRQHVGSGRFTSRFDLVHSGAMLTWKHLCPHVATIDCPPFALRMLEFYDLGGPWNEPDHTCAQKARWLHNYLMHALPRTPEAWTPVLMDYAAHERIAMDIGARLQAASMRLIKGAIRHPHFVKIGDFTVPALNGLPHGLLNDALHALLTEHPAEPFAASWQVLGDASSRGVIKWSLRGRKGGLDLGALCKSLDPNGGGHPQAAGFATHTPVLFV